MAIDLGVVGLVGSAIKLSWTIYDKGFSKEKSSRAFLLPLSHFHNKANANPS
jgi:hypothetical protein